MARRALIRNLREPGSHRQCGVQSIGAIDRADIGIVIKILRVNIVGIDPQIQVLAAEIVRHGSKN